MPSERGSSRMDAAPELARTGARGLAGATGPTDQQRQTAAALGLLQRLPPQALNAHLDAFTKIAPHLEKTLERYVTRGLEIMLDAEKHRYFIACPFNCRDTEQGAERCHRSPWSDQYMPAPKDANAPDLYHPPGRFRTLEEQFNEVFDAYKTAYYEGGVSSVYIWDLEEGFAGAFLIRKELEQGPDLPTNVWESIHVLEVRESSRGETSNSTVTTHVAEYKLNSSVRVHATTGTLRKGESELGAFVTRQQESKSKEQLGRGKKLAGDDHHIAFVGKMIEDAENAIRQNLDQLHVAKQREVLHAVRSLEGSLPAQPQQHQAAPALAQVGR